MALPAAAVAAPFVTCDYWGWPAVVLSLATGALWTLRVALQPWYSDLPLAGFARWITGAFLGLCTACLTFVAAFVASYHCAP